MYSLLKKKKEAGSIVKSDIKINTDAKIKRHNAIKFLGCITD